MRLAFPLGTEGAVALVDEGIVVCGVCEISAATFSRFTGKIYAYGIDTPY